MKRLLLFALLSTGYLTIFAQDSTVTESSSDVSMITNRPGVSESSKAVFKSGFQIETGFQFSDFDVGSSFQFPNIGFLYGVSNNVEIRVFSYYEFNNYNADQIGLMLGAKINLVELNGWIPEMAFVFNQELPTIIVSKLSNSLPKDWNSNAMIAWSHPLGEKLGVSGNFIYTLQTKSTEISTGKTIDFANQFGYTFNVGYTINDKFGTFLEAYGNNNFSTGFTNSVDGGVWHRVHSKFQIDLQVGLGIDTKEYFVMVGFSRLFLK